MHTQLGLIRQASRSLQIHINPHILLQYLAILSPFVSFALTYTFSLQCESPINLVVVSVTQQFLRQ